jgi:serine/threonine protein kinase
MPLLPKNHNHRRQRSKATMLLQHPAQGQGQGQVQVQVPPALAFQVDTGKGAGVRQRISALSPRKANASNNKNAGGSNGKHHNQNQGNNHGNHHHNGNCNDRQRCSPRSLTLGTLFLATICCGVVNMATLLVLPLENGNAATKIDFSTAVSKSLFGFLTFTQQQRLVHQPPSAPRVVYLDGDKSRPALSIIDDDNNNNVNRESEAETTAAATTTKAKDPCVPMADWQTRSFPTCNILHEIDMGLGASETNTDASSTSSKSTPAQSLKPLGEGWFRTTWQMEAVDDITTVLKTLRVVREFSPEFYELHRRDAVAMERLTSSDFVMNVYAYCGQSAVNEMADFAVPGLQSLEAFDRRMRGHDSRQADMMKLRVAASVATGVADIHDVESMDGRPSMVHYDLNPRNVALCAGGRPKLNDFNIAEFLRWNPETNETCGFSSRMHEPWWRAPEEMNTTTATSKEDTVLLDEKVDIYALGNVLYHILSTHSPRGKMKRERMEIVRPVVAQGIAPKLPEPYKSGTDPVHAAFRNAMALCFAKDPKERGSAEDVANLLTNAVAHIAAVQMKEDKKAASNEKATEENADDDKEGSEEESE